MGAPRPIPSSAKHVMVEDEDFRISLTKGQQFLVSCTNKYVRPFNDCDFSVDSASDTASASAYSPDNNRRRLSDGRRTLLMSFLLKTKSSIVSVCTLGKLCRRTVDTRERFEVTTSLM